MSMPLMRTAVIAFILALTSSALQLQEEPMKSDGVDQTLIKQHRSANIKKTQRIATMVAMDMRFLEKGADRFERIAAFNDQTEGTDVFICTDKESVDIIKEFERVVQVTFAEDGGGIPPFMKEKTTPLAQWWRLKQCYKALEAFAAEKQQNYSFIFKTRVDIKLNLRVVDIAQHASHDTAEAAFIASDYAFGGTAEVMSVIARLIDEWENYDVAAEVYTYKPIDYDLLFASDWSAGKFDCLNFPLKPVGNICSLSFQWLAPGPASHKSNLRSILMENMTGLQAQGEESSNVLNVCNGVYGKDAEGTMATKHFRSENAILMHLLSHGIVIKGLGGTQVKFLEKDLTSLESYHTNGIMNALASYCQKDISETSPQVLESSRNQLQVHQQAHTREHSRSSPPPVALFLKAEPLAWTHVPKCGSSLENSLVRLPGACPDLALGDLVFGPEDHGGTPFTETFPDWQKHCPGLKPVGSGTSISEHAMVGSLYDDVYRGHGVIMLRQPEQRLISMYNHGLIEKKLFTKSMNVAEFANMTKGCAVRTLTKEYAYASRKIGWFGCMGVDLNYQVLPSLQVSLADVAEARKRLRAYAFVGITDEWPLSICLLHAMFGGDCHPAEFEDNNIGSGSPQAYDTAPLQGFVDQYDGALYEEALSIFSSNLRRYGVTKQSCQPCFKSASLEVSVLRVSPGAQNVLALTQLRAQKLQGSPTETFRTAPQCRDAIRRQRTQFSSHWQPMVVHNSESHDSYDEVLSNEGINLAYVINQKVASQSMYYAFGAFGNQSSKHRVQYSGASASAVPQDPTYSNYRFIDVKDQWNLTRSIEKLRSQVLFTVVRDPLACAWSAYTEVSHRASEDLALAAPCNAGDDRYLEYLNLVMDGAARTPEIFHSFPQVVKVDVLQMLNRDSFDFVVRLENFENDMRVLFAQLDTPPDETTIQEFLKRFKQHGDDAAHPRDTNCDEEIAVTSSEYGLSARTCKAACELYDVDFACFGYPRPSCCAV